MIGILLALVVLGFLALVLVRTLKFTPKPQPAVSQESVDMDQDAVIAALEGCGEKAYKIGCVVKTGGDGERLVLK